MFKSISTTYIDKVLRISHSLTGIKPVLCSPLEKSIIIDNIKTKIKVFNQYAYIDALTKDELILVRNNVMAPCWSANVNGKIVTYVNIARYDVLEKDGRTPKTNINIRSILGLIAVGLVQRNTIINYQQFKSNVILRAAAMNAYNRVFVRNLDMLYAISSSPVHNKAISFMVNKFFLINLFGMDSNFANIDNVAFNDGSKSSVTFDGIKALISDVPETAYTDLDSFINELRSRFSLLKGLDTMTFLRNIIIKLGEYSSLILENYPFFLGIMVSISIQANIVRDIRYSGIISDNDINRVVTGVFQCIH